MPKKRPWTVREDELLCARGMLLEEIAEWFGRSVADVRRRCEQLGVPAEVGGDTVSAEMPAGEDAEAAMLRWCEEETLRLLPLITQIARSLDMPLPLEDLVQEGAMACFKHLPRFDKSRGLKVETFIGIRIRGAMQDYARQVGYFTHGGRRTGRTEHIVSIDQVVYEADSDHERTVAHFLEDPAAGLPEPSAWNDLLKGFSDRERLVLLERFVAGRKMREIGDTIGVGETRVVQIVQYLLGRLKELDAIDGRVRDAVA